MQKVMCYIEEYVDEIRKRMKDMLERGYKVVSMTMTENSISEYYTAIVVYEKIESEEINNDT